MAKLYAPTAATPPWGSYSHTQKTTTYDAVKAAGEEGISREDICKKTNLPKQRVWFYLSELRRGGFIKRLGEAIDPAQLNPIDAQLHAMAALENCVIVNAGDHLSTCSTCKAAKDDEAKRCNSYKEISRAFVRYTKIKSRVLGGSTAGEQKAALRLSIIELIKLVL